MDKGPVVGLGITLIKLAKVTQTQFIWIHFLAWKWKT